jgi:hypothetical protein
VYVNDVVLTTPRGLSKLTVATPVPGGITKTSSRVVEEIGVRRIVSVCVLTVTPVTVFI